MATQHYAPNAKCQQGRHSTRCMAGYCCVFIKSEKLFATIVVPLIRQEAQLETALCQFFWVRKQRRNHRARKLAPVLFLCLGIQKYSTVFVVLHKTTLP